MSEGRGYFIKDECQTILARINFDFTGTLGSGFPCFLCFDSASVLQPCLPLRAESSPPSVLQQEYSAWRSLWFQRSTGISVVTGELQMPFQTWLWDVRAHPPFSPTLSSLSSSISIQPRGLTLAISNLQRVLLASHVCFLFTFSVWEANSRWFFSFGFKVFSWSLSAIQPLKVVHLITSTFWNWNPCRPAFILLKLSQLVENRLELSDHKWLL